MVAGARPLVRRADEVEGLVSVPTFVVGTGRCGSTMLSNMLRQHPRVLSLSEFYASVVDFGRRMDETFRLERLMELSSGR